MPKPVRTAAPTPARRSSATGLSACAALCLGMLLQGCALPLGQPDPGAAHRLALDRLQRSEGGLAEARPLVASRLAKLSRLRDNAFRLLAANADACPRVRPSGGFTLESMWERSFSMPLFEGVAHREALGMDGTGFVVAHVAAGSPAERAGLRVGDRLLEVEGRPAPEPASHGAHARAKARVGRMVRAGGEDGRLALTVERGGRGLPIRMAQVRACDYPVRLLTSHAVNAFADGRSILVTEGMLEFLHADVEHQAILAHELAHNVAGHGPTVPVGGPAAVGRPAAVGPRPLLARAARRLRAPWEADESRRLAYAQRYELEADRLGSRFMAKAGMDVAALPRVWGRFAQLDPVAIEHASTHPASAERLLNLRDAVREAAARRRAGTPPAPGR